MLCIYTMQSGAECIGLPECIVCLHCCNQWAARTQAAGVLKLREGLQASACCEGAAPRHPNHAVCCFVALMLLGRVCSQLCICIREGLS